MTPGKVIPTISLLCFFAACAQPRNREQIPVAESFVAVDTGSIPWADRSLPGNSTIQVKRLLNDADLLVTVLRYPAGVRTPSHTHVHGHGFFVLEGTLRTSRGSFGPGAFVWFGGGREVMEHGAAGDTDAVVLFIAKEPFRVDYAD